ncbi:MAG: hypothetical protein AAF909_15465 [Pseudomonadota bacterium]
MSDEEIYVSYSIASGIPYVSPEMARHKILNYRDRNGREFRIEAMPTERARSTSEKAGQLLEDQFNGTGPNRRPSGFGRIRVVEDNRRETRKGLPRETIARGADLSRPWRKIREFGQTISDWGFDYDAERRNSNSFVDRAADWAGLQRPTNVATWPEDAGERAGQKQKFWTPGSKGEFRMKDSARQTFRPSAPRATVSSMRSGDDLSGSTPLGMETNALDVIGDANGRNTPPPQPDHRLRFGEVRRIGSAMRIKFK